MRSQLDSLSSLRQPGLQWQHHKIKDVAWTMRQVAYFVERWRTEMLARGAGEQLMRVQAGPYASAMFLVRDPAQSAFLHRATRDLVQSVTISIQL